MAEEHRGWSYRRIQGALANLGHVLAHKTIASVLKQHGIEPAPDRSTKTTWKEFLTRHWHQIVASDFFTIEVWTSRGLKRFIVLFFIDLSTRRVELAGIASNPNGLVRAEGHLLLIRRSRMKWTQTRHGLRNMNFGSRRTDSSKEQWLAPPQSNQKPSSAQRTR